MWNVLKSSVRNSRIASINNTYDLDILTLIKGQSEYFQLKPEWIWSMFEIESGWISTATRFEPKFCNRLRLLNPTMSEESLKKRAASWGLGQVLGQTALEMGFDTKTDISELTTPTHGVHYALQYLHRKKLAYPKLDIFAWIAAYNAGSVRLAQDGKYINQHHVDKFKIALSYFEANPL